MRLATLHELQTVYGVKSLYDMLEISKIDSHNRHLHQRWMDRKQAR